MVQTIVIKGISDENQDFTLYLMPETANAVLYIKVDSVTTKRIPLDNDRFKVEFLKCVPEPSIFQGDNSLYLVEDILYSVVTHYFPKRKRNSVIKDK